jgi:hypothetical protein
MTYMKLLSTASLLFKELVLDGVVNSSVCCLRYFEESCIQRSNTCDEISSATYSDKRLLEAHTLTLKCLRPFFTKNHFNTVISSTNVRAQPKCATLVGAFILFVEEHFWHLPNISQSTSHYGMHMQNTMIQKKLFT